MNREIILDVKKYIDENLKSELTVDLLSKRAGFSTYHFSKLFSHYIGLPVMEYVRRMRLSGAIYELCMGKRIIDVALDYGFESHNGFSKAFKKVYGYSPEEYRKRTVPHRPPSDNPLKLSLTEDIKTSRVRIIESEGFYIAGSIITTSEELSSVAMRPAIWNSIDLSEIENKIYALAMPKRHGEYYISFPVSDNLYRLVSGVRIDDVENVDHSLYLDYVPGGLYAVFSPDPTDGGREEFAKNIKSAWNYIYESWLPSSGYAIDQARLDYEFYDERCHNDGPFTMDICIPLIKL